MVTNTHVNNIHEDEGGMKQNHVSDLHHHHHVTPRSTLLVSRTSSYLLPLLLLFVFSAQWCGGAAVGCDDSCANGGRLLMPSNVFGVCRCKCNAGFSGPKCQFAVKKRDSFLHLTPSSSTSSSSAAASQPLQHKTAAVAIAKPQAVQQQVQLGNKNREDEEERMLSEAEYGAGQREAEDMLRAWFMSHRL